MLGILLLLFTAPGAHAITLTTTDRLLERCQQKHDAGSCYELAHLYLESSGEANHARGREYLALACRTEMQRDCTESEAEQRRKEVRAAQVTAEVQKDVLLQSQPAPPSEQEKQCLAGNAEACGKEALYLFYLAPQRNPKRARELYEKGCQFGDKASCDSLELIRKGIVHVFDVDA